MKMSSTSSCIVTQEAVEGVARGYRKAGQTLVFTNGCFDILHAGHVAYLAEAAALGDVLVVGLNTDASVRTIKGSLRPVNPQDQRARVLSSLSVVTHVVLFDEPDPASLILRIQPDILVKGADWPEKRIAGAESVRASGGRVVRVELTSGISTTAIIQRILERYAKEPQV